MANRIKGITVEIGGDTTGLSKALDGVNKDIKTTQASLKDVNKLLKLDPTNTELLSQKQKLLTQRVDETKKKLDALKEAEKQVTQQFEEGKVSEEQVEALKREIIETEQALKSAEKEAGSFNATLAKVSATADKVSEATGKAAQATKGISAAAAAGIASITGAGLAAAAAADDYNTLAKQTGLSTETLQTAKLAEDLIDVSYETFTGSITKMVSKLRTNEEAFNKMGIVTRDANGEFKSTEQIFWQTINTLSVLKDETERDIVAQELFGKSAAELAGIIDDGGKAFKEFGAEAKDAGQILSQDTLDGLNEVNDTVDKLKATATATLAEAGANALEALTPVIEKVLGVLNKVLGFLGSISPRGWDIILIILSAVAAASPLLTGFSKIAGLVSALSTAIPILTGAFGAFNAVLLANPIIIVIAGITALVAAFVVLWNKCEGFRNFWINLWENIKDFCSKAVEAIGNFITNAWNKIKDTTQKVWNGVKSAVNTALTAVKNTAKEKLNNVKTAFEENGGGVKGVVAASWEAIKGAYTAGFSLINNLTNGKLAEIKDAIVNAFKNLANSALTWGKDLLQNFINGIKSKISALTSTISNVAGKVKSFLGFSEPEEGPLSNFHTYAPDMMKLFAQGITQNTGLITDAMNKSLTQLSEMAGSTQLQPATTTTNNSTSYGGVSINVYGAAGQSVNELADIVMDKLQFATMRKGAALT